MLKKLSFQPGINREGTNYSAEGGWYDSDMVRFRKGRPEKIGGWIERSATTLFGVCRSLHNWLSLAKFNYLGIGTNAKVYVESGGSVFDITPSYDYGTSELILGIDTSDPVTVRLAVGEADPSPASNYDGWIVGDAGRISDPTVSGASGDAGGPFEYVIVTAIGGGPNYDLTVTREAFNTVNSAKAIIEDTASAFLQGPTMERIPPARVANPPISTSPVTAAAGTNGCIGVTQGSNRVLIRQGSHSCLVGDYVAFLRVGNTGWGSSTLVDLDFLVPAGFRVTNVFDNSSIGDVNNNYEIEIGTTDAVTKSTVIETTALTDSATEIIVDAITDFSNGDYIRIDNEYIQINAAPTSVPDKFPTVIRARFGSTAVAHNIGATVSRVDFFLPDNIASNPTLTYLLHDVNAGVGSYVGSAGWGAGAWGAGAWGEPSATAETIRIWSIDNYGEDLILCPRDGIPYYWDTSNKVTDGAPNITGSVTGAPVAQGVANAQAMPLSTIGNREDPGYSVDGAGGTPGTTSFAPTKVRQLIVYPSTRSVIAFGCSDRNGDFSPMLVRWSSDGYPGSWDPLDTDNRGTTGYTYLNTGSEIIGACRSRAEILIWTDAAVYKMETAEAPFYFGFTELASDISIMGPMAYTAAAGSIYWMGDRNFYTYGGTIQTVPCTVLNYVFSDLNYAQKELIFAANNSEFNEVTFFYPSGGVTEVDRYATFNYGENVWTIGVLDRTAWSDSGLREKPQAAQVVSTDPETSKIYEHEVGTTNAGTAITAYIESAYFDMDEGDHFSFVSRVIPDVRFEDGDTMTLEIKKKDFPNDSDEVTYSSTIMSNTTQKFVRVRGRQMAVKFESTGTDEKWRLGDSRIDIRPDGRR